VEASAARRGTEFGILRRTSFRDHRASSRAEVTRNLVDDRWRRAGDFADTVVSLDPVYAYFDAPTRDLFEVWETGAAGKKGHGTAENKYGPIYLAGRRRRFPATRAW